MLYCVFNEVVENISAVFDGVSTKRKIRFQENLNENRKEKDKSGAAEAQARNTLMK